MWRSPDREQVAVIYRDRHSRDECCLPKGKLDPGEDWEQAALREVLEETCSEAEILGFGGLLPYYVGRRPKIVVYFEMVAVCEGRFQPSAEVRDMAWLAPESALAALSHDSEREMLCRLVTRSRRDDCAGGLAPDMGA